MTAEQFAHVSGQHDVCELVRGEVQPMSPGGGEHGRVSVRILGPLLRFVEPKQLGHLLTNEVGLIVARDPDTVRGADVAYISYARLAPGPLPRGFLAVAPELVVEVLGLRSTWGTLDDKIAEYHAFGVDLVWVVDPHTRTVVVAPRAGERYVLHPGEVLAGEPVLEGFRLALDDIFA